jgi:hypothetical protein
MARGDRTMTARRNPWWRSALSWLLLLVFCISAPLALLAGWARISILDENRYVATMQPLSSDPRIQQAMVNAAEQALGLTPTEPEARRDAGVGAFVLQALGIESAAAATPPPAVVRATRPPEATALPSPTATSAPSPTAAATSTPSPLPSPTLPPAPTEAPAATPVAPGLLEEIGGEIDAAGIPQALVSDVIGSVMQSPEFGRAWEMANRKAWAGMMSVRSGSGPVALDLSGAASRIDRELEDRGIPGIDQFSIPPDALSVEVLDADTADDVRTVLRQVNVLGIALPIVALLSLVGSVWAAGSKLGALRRAGVGLALSTIVTLLGLLIGQQGLTARLDGSGMADAARAVIDTLLRTPVLWGMVMIVAGIALALLAGLLSVLRRR